jgi:hypothetical protein
MANNQQARSAHVTAAYAASNPDPIAGRDGERVQVGEIELWDDNPAWVWCKCASVRGTSGWVPASYLEVSGATGVLRREYDARELTMHGGEPLTILEEEGGWYWCRERNGTEGWLPIKCVEIDAL